MSIEAYRNANVSRAERDFDIAVEQVTHIVNHHPAMRGATREELLALTNALLTRNAVNALTDWMDRHGSR